MPYAAGYDITVTISGEAKVGKTTAAQIIQEALHDFGAKVALLNVDEYAVEERSSLALLDKKVLIIERVIAKQPRQDRA